MRAAADVCWSAERSAVGPFAAAKLEIVRGSWTAASPFGRSLLCSLCCLSSSLSSILHPTDQPSIAMLTRNASRLAAQCARQHSRGAGQIDGGTRADDEGGGGTRAGRSGLQPGGSRSVMHAAHRIDHLVCTRHSFSRSVHLCALLRCHCCCRLRWSSLPLSPPDDHRCVVVERQQRCP